MQRARWIFEDGKNAYQSGNKLGWAMFHCSACGHKEYIRDGQCDFRVPVGIVYENEKVTPLPWNTCAVCGSRMTNCDDWMNVHD